MDQQQMQQMQAHNQWVSSLGVPQYSFGQVLGGNSPMGIGFAGVGGGEGGGDGSGGSSSGGGGMGTDLLTAMLYPGGQDAATNAMKLGYTNPQSFSPQQQAGVQQGGGYVYGGHWHPNAGPSNYNGVTMPQDMANQLNMFKQMTPLMTQRFKSMSPLLAGLFGGGAGGGFNTNFGQSATIGGPAPA